ncbi:MAG: hypothetical protein AAF553_08955 [Pseudomonadota bacterium]
MAKKKSSAELKEEGIALGEQITLARKRTVNFALLMSKEGLVLQTDVKKGPDILWRNAKKMGGGPKGAMGTMAVKGKVIELNCLDDSAPNQLPKLAKKWLAERGQAYKVIMITPSGEIGDEEGDEALEDEVMAEDAGGAGAGADGDRTEQDAAAAPEPEIANADAEETEEAKTSSSGASEAKDKDPLEAELTEQFEALAEKIEQAKQSVHAGAAKKAATLSETVGGLIGDNPQKAAGMLKLLSKTVDDAIAFGVNPTADADIGEALQAEQGNNEAQKKKRTDALKGLNRRVQDLLAEFA